LGISDEVCVPCFFTLLANTILSDNCRSPKIKGEVYKYIYTYTLHATIFLANFVTFWVTAKYSFVKKLRLFNAYIQQVFLFVSQNATKFQKNTAFAESLEKYAERARCIHMKIELLKL
jgi:hypothetical protein